MKTLGPRPLARLFGVEYRTIQRWIDRGILPGFRTPACGHCRVPVAIVREVCLKRGLLQVVAELDRLYPSGEDEMACPE